MIEEYIKGKLYVSMAGDMIAVGFLIVLFVIWMIIKITDRRDK